MSLADRYLTLLEEWDSLFAQQRTATHAREFALAMPACIGERTVSAALCALDRADSDWSGGYKFFNRSDWDAVSLFDPILRHFGELFPGGPIVVAVDDTKRQKSGKKITSASWQRDPMSPPFRANLIWAQRFLQFSLIFPFHKKDSVSARALPIRFEDAPVLKKPGKRASEEQWKSYREEKKRKNLSTQARATAMEVRARLDQLGQQSRNVLLALDGSFCNRTFFHEPFERIHLIARARKDARLCHPAPAGSRARYDSTLFTPESVRQDDAIPWRESKVFYGGTTRKIRFKEKKNVLWRRGAGTRPLRLIVVAAVPYRLSRNARQNYRSPAYLLTDDLSSSITFLLQAYFDRWQIEVNHREEKTYFGVGEAHVFSNKAAPRVPAFLTACYSLLHLAAILEFGPLRSSHFRSLPLWRRHPVRPSIADLLRLLRRDLHETRDSPISPRISAENLALSSAA
jgi:hypothetical protein